LLLLFLSVVIGVGAWIGASNLPGAWYDNLEKPPFNPANWLFAPVWSALYVMIALAGWRTALIAPRSVAMGLWIAQMVLNWAWSPAFFSAQAIWPAAMIVVLLLVTIVGFIVSVRRLDRFAAWLFVPYAGWVLFATLLNLSIGILN
jgi:tryptophan-rich sensory protein